MIKLVSVQYHFAAVLNSGVFHWISSDFWLANHPVSCCVLWACAKCFNEHFEVPSKVAKSKGCSADRRNFRRASDKSDSRFSVVRGDCDALLVQYMYNILCNMIYSIRSVSIIYIYIYYLYYIYIYDTWMFLNVLECSWMFLNVLECSWMFLNVLDPFHHSTLWPSLAQLSHPVSPVGVAEWLWPSWLSVRDSVSSNIQQMHWAELEMVGSTITIWLFNIAMENPL